MEFEGCCCVVCEEKYGDDRLPLFLLCGHTLCSECVKRLIASNPSCPECRRPIRTKNPRDFTVNFEVLRIARSPSESITNSGSPTELNAGRCEAHNNLKFFHCTTCETNVCRDCVVLGHKTPPAGNCSLISVSEYLNKKKLYQVKALDSKTHQLRFYQGEISGSLARLQKAKQSQEATIEKLRQQMEEERRKILAIDAHTNEAQRALHRVDAMKTSLKLMKDKVQQSHSYHDVEHSISLSGVVVSSVNTLTAEAADLVRNKILTVITEPVPSSRDLKMVKMV